MRQGMYCHACGKDFSVHMEIQADGNNVFKCPYCQAVWYPTTSTVSTSDAYTIYRGIGDVFTSAAWNSSSTSTATW